MLSTRVWIVAFLTLLAAAQTPVWAQDLDAKMEEQYNAIALARTKAELALRKARMAQDHNDAAWRVASSGADAAYQKLEKSLDRKIEEEQGKDDARDDEKLKLLNEKKDTVQAEWQKFADVDRPALETRYHSANDMTNALNDLLNNLSNLEHAWKDTGMDLGLIEKAYMSLAQRAEGCQQAAQKALGELQAVQASWEKRS
jgi:hypothetical protein